MSTPATNAFEGFGSTVAATPTVNLPAFTPNDAAPWFKRVEALFRIKNITNTNRRADYVIGALPPDTFSRLSDWLDDQDSDDLTYEDVKTAIIKECEMSPEERSQRLLDLLRTPLGDQRPSDALREIKSLTKMMKPDGTTEILDLSRVLWMTRLPAEMRTHITEFASRPLPELMRLADSVRGTSRIAQPVTAAPLCQADDVANNDLALAAQRRRPSSRTSTMKNTWCYFHKRFGRDARNCREPCSFQKNL